MHTQYGHKHKVERSKSEISPLRLQATWNMNMLQTQDLMKSAQAALEKKSPKDVPFSKL